MAADYRGIDINGNALEVTVDSGVIVSVSPIGYDASLPRHPEASHSIRGIHQPLGAVPCVTPSV